MKTTLSFILVWLMLLFTCVECQGEQPALTVTVDSASAVCFSPDGEWLAVGGGDSVCVYSAKSGSLSRNWKAHYDGVGVALFSRDGSILATAVRSDQQKADATIKLWNSATGRILRTLNGHRAAVMAVAFSSDDRLIATASADRTVGIWDVGTGRLLRRLSGHHDRVTSVAFSSDGRIVASGSDDKTVRVWDYSTGKLLLVLKAKDLSGIVTVGFRLNSRVVEFISEEGRLQVKDVKSGNSRVITFEKLIVSAAAFSASGRLAVTCDNFRTATDQTQGIIEVHDTTSGKRLLAVAPRDLGYIDAVAISGDERRIAVAGFYQHRESITIWPVRKASRPAKVFEKPRVAR